MLEALDTDEPGEALHYAHLFSDDDDLNQGLTAEIIRSQHLTERLEFLQVCVWLGAGSCMCGGGGELGACQGVSQTQARCFVGRAAWRE